MKDLKEFRRFVRIKTTEGNHAEIRAYIADNLEAMALLFQVSPDKLRGAIESIADDAEVASKVLGTIADKGEKARDERKDTRARAAQAAADALATAVRWEGQRAHLDVAALLAAPIERKSLVVFTCDAFTVGVYMAPLLDLAKIKRVRANVSGWVDAEGLHIRWGKGGLNLRPRIDPDAEKVIVRLPPKAAVVAA